jgi:hypothetical protein
MNDRIKEFLSECLVYPVVGIFMLAVYYEKLYYFIKICYYRLFGIVYIIQNDKFNNYPMRINK